MARLHVLARWNASPEEHAVIKETWPSDAQILFAHGGNDRGTIRPFLPKMEALIGRITEEIIAEAPRLKLVHVLGHGVDEFFVGALRDLIIARRITVAKANAATVPIAEFTIMAMIALTRRTFKFHEALAFQGSSNPALRKQRLQGGIGGELLDSTLGLVGFGNIGKAIAVRARAFGMTIGAVARQPASIDCDQYGITFTATLDELEAFVARCDYLVLCLPDTPATKSVLNARCFAAMKPGAYLVNIARASLLDEQALWEALQSGRLAGAALDVHNREAERGKGGYSFPTPIDPYNVILTPHYAGSTYEARMRALQTIGENLHRLAAGEPLLNVVDVEAGF